RIASLPGESVEREWREAKVAAAAGRLAAAAARLNGVRRQLLAAGSLAEAARATFDQVQLRLDVGRADEVAELAADLAGAFPGGGAGASGGEIWARKMAALGRLAGGPPKEFRAASRELRRRLRYGPLPTAERAPLIVPWRT